MVAALGIVGCASLEESEPSPTEAAPTSIPASTGSERLASTPGLTGIPAPDSQLDASILEAEIYPAEGSLLGSPTGTLADRGGDVELSFENTPIEAVVAKVIGEILGETYVLDARVTGNITLTTNGVIAEGDVIPLLETALLGIDARLYRDRGMYRIAPASAGILGEVNTSRSASGGAGYQTLVVLLRYIGAAHMKTILDGVHGSNVEVYSQAGRNVIVLSGNGGELDVYLDTISIFDVDSMAGMSVGIFPVQQADVATLRSELEEILGLNQGVDSAVPLKLIEISRLSALLAITPQAGYLRTVQVWLERLDRSVQTSSTSRHNVYFVQHGDATYLAGLLQQMFGAVTTSGATSTPIAPGLIPSNSGEVSPGLLTPPAGSAASADSQVRITADAENNALLIRAAPEIYQEIKQIVDQLDVQPGQVLVQTSFAEVKLRDEFSFGFEWFFTNGGSDGGRRGEGLLDLGAPGLGSIVPGFSYSIIDSADAVRAVLNTLASDSLVKIISSPSLVVLDNRTARINIGDQVPVRTSESTSIATSGANPIIVSTIQFRDTGVDLEVTPHLSNSGTITLEISQNVSTVAETTSSGIDSPTINQREIVTTVIVGDGETLVLGGFISDSDSNSESGLPGLRNIPGLGWLFGNRSSAQERTELIVMITPTAMFDRATARRITEELRSQMVLLSGGETT